MYDKLQYLFYANVLEICMRASIDKLEYAVAALSRLTDEVFEWTGNAALKLNALKTKTIICGYRDFVDRILLD